MERDWDRLFELMGPLNNERDQLIREKIKDIDTRQQEYEKNFYLQVDSYNFYNKVYGTNKRGIEPHVHHELLERELLEYAEHLYDAEMYDYEMREQEKQPEQDEVELEKDHQPEIELKHENAAGERSENKSSRYDFIRQGKEIGHKPSNDNRKEMDLYDSFRLQIDSIGQRSGNYDHMEWDMEKNNEDYDRDGYEEYNDDD